ncbi:MAG: hypothetical protein AAF587_00650 [Bacteroidota bacterium]
MAKESIQSLPSKVSSAQESQGSEQGTPLRTLAPPPLQLKASRVDIENTEEEKPSSKKTGPQFSPPLNGELPNDSFPDSPAVVQHQRASSTVIQRDKGKSQPSLPEGKDYMFKKYKLICRVGWLKKQIEEDFGDIFWSRKLVTLWFKRVRKRRNESWVTDNMIEVESGMAMYSFNDWSDWVGKEDSEITSYHWPGIVTDFYRAFGVGPVDKDLSAERAIRVLVYYPKGDSKRIPRRIKVFVHGHTLRKANDKQIKIITDEIIQESERTTGRKIRKKGNAQKFLIDHLEASRDGVFFQLTLNIGKSRCRKWFTGGRKTTGRNHSSSHKPRSAPKRPKWATPLEKKIQKLQKRDKEKNPRGKNIPDICHLTYVGGWNMQAVVFDADGKTKLWATAKVSKRSKAKNIYRKLKTRLHKQEISSALKAIEKESRRGQSHGGLPLDPKYNWANKLKDAIWTEVKKKMAGENWNYRPAGLSIQPINKSQAHSDSSEGEARIYLVVYAKVKVKAANKNTHWEIRNAVLPQPLRKGMSPDSVVPVIKRTAEALHDKKVRMPTSRTTGQALEPAYPSQIYAGNFRQDYKTVTGGTQKFLMNLDTDARSQNHAEAMVKAYRIRYSYTSWKLYRIPDGHSLLDKQKATANKDSRNWMKRQRPDLQSHFTQNKDEVAELSYCSAKHKQSANITFDIPDEEGIYVLYAETHIDPTPSEFRLPSKSVFVFKAQEGESLASEITGSRTREMNRLKKLIASEDTPTELRLEYLQQTKELEAMEHTSMFTATDNSIKSLVSHKHLLALLLYYIRRRKRSKKSLSELWADDLKKEELSKLWKAIQIQLKDSLNKDPEQKIIDLRQNVIKSRKKLSKLSEGIRKFKKDFHQPEDTLVPVATFVSKVSGQAYPMNLILGEDKQSTLEWRHFTLIDASNPQNIQKYEGIGKTKKEAIKAAFKDFATGNEYGEGVMVYRVPGVMGLTPIKNAPRDSKVAMKWLKGIAMVAGIAALALSAVVTAGTSLAVFAAVVGTVAAVTGAIVSAHNIYQRSHNNSFEWDAETALDILGIVGGIVSVVSAARGLSSFSNGVKAANAVDDAAQLAKAERLFRLDKVLLIHAGADLVGNAIFTPLKVLDDLKKVEESGLPTKVKEAMKREIINNAIISGFMILKSGFDFRSQVREARQTKARLKEQEAALVAKENEYKDRLKDNHLADSDGNLKLKPAKKDASTEGDPDSGTSSSRTSTTRPDVEAPHSNSTPRSSNGDHGNNASSRSPESPSAKTGGNEKSKTPKSKEPAWNDENLSEAEAFQFWLYHVTDETFYDRFFGEGGEDGLKKWLLDKYNSGQRYNPEVKGWRSPFKGKGHLDGQTRGLSAEVRLQRAEAYIQQHESNLLARDGRSLQGLLDAHGDWRSLHQSLDSGGGNQQKIAQHLEEYQLKILENLKDSPQNGEVNVYIPEGTRISKEIEVEVKFSGPDAGKVMLKREAYMTKIIGPEWSKKLNMRFSTGTERLERVKWVSNRMTSSQRADLDIDMSKKTELLTFAKMKLKAGKDKQALAHVRERMEGANIDIVEVNDFVKANQHPAVREKKRKDLLLEIDDLEKRFKHSDGEERVRLGQEITFKSMDLQFYSQVGQISPGGSSDSINLHGRYQQMLNNLQKIEQWESHLAGDALKAMPKHEIFASMRQFGKASKNKELITLIDQMAGRIQKSDSLGLKDISDKQMRQLFRDFRVHSYRAIKRMKLMLVAQSGGEFPHFSAKWTDRNLKFEDMVRLYEAEEITSSEKLTRKKLREKYEQGERFDTVGRRWKQIFKGNGSKEYSFDVIAHRTPVMVDQNRPATRLGMDEALTSKFKNLWHDAVDRILAKLSLEQIKGQLFEELTNLIGLRQSIDIESVQNGEVGFYRGDQVSGPAPDEEGRLNENAQLTDGVIAEVTWVNQEPDSVFIHQAYEAKSGSASKVHTQVEWSIERIFEFGISLSIRHPDGSERIHSFSPQKIKMRPRSKQKSSYSVFTASNVKPKSKLAPTEQFTHRRLSNFTTEELHHAALMILRRKSQGASSGSGSSAGSSIQLSPNPQSSTPIQQKKNPSQPFQLRSVQKKESAWNPGPYRLPNEKTYS